MNLPLSLVLDLQTRYTEPQRFYHTLAHIQTMLTDMAILHPEPLSPALVLAAWFHDAIYNPWAPDNEERSAELAIKYLDLAVDDDTATKVVELIWRTKDHAVDQEVIGECQAFLDADLLSLGRDYLRNLIRIRLEYSHLSNAAFRKGRALWIKSMLARKRLFYTELAHSRFERRAREFLEQEHAAWSHDAEPYLAELSQASWGLDARSRTKLSAVQNVAALDSAVRGLFAL